MKKTTKKIEIRRKLQLTRTVIRNVPAQDLQNVQGGGQRGKVAVTTCDYTM